MASNTPNLHLYKKNPIEDQNDTFNIDTMLNNNWDKIDDTIGDIQNELSSDSIKTTYEYNINTNAFTDIEKSKLAGVEANANNYHHPATHPASIINEEVDRKFITDSEKTKLAGIELGAEVNNLSDTNAADLTDGGDSSLHYHSNDRNRANHTG
ncbi:MAG: hypothetical protein MJA31_15575, partial [Clostridia bacterium]|nr:hypothetical protein [Clostridia bacterium]